MIKAGPKLLQGAIYLAVGGFLGWLLLLGFWATHIGAPQLAYDCPPHHTLHTEWVRDSSPVGRGAPGTLEYHGWREWASCSSSLGLTAGSGHHKHRRRR